MVLVVGVLAMLFIIGSTLLIVGRFERQTVQISASAKNMEAVSQGAVEPIIVLLRSDLLGANGKAYLRGWESNPPPLFDDDYGDYAGVMVDASNVPVANLRNGDLFLSALEPYEAGAGGWNLFAASWFRDVIKPTPPISLPPGTIVVGLIDDPAFSGIVEDADGDGIRDAVKLLNVGFSDSFGGTFSMGLRVIPHNGMVWLNRMTHPTLLAQVIHPSDRSVMTMDELRTAIGNLGLGPADENRLRRRFMLAPLLPTPDPGQNYSDVAQPLVQLLPITTGYSDPGRNVDSWTKTGANDGPVNQWLMFQTKADWEGLIKPVFALTDKNYQANNDRYDRRHLISRESSDDALRPQRDERRLRAFPLTLGIVPDTVTFNLENIISPADASLVSPASVDPNRRPLAYGVMDYRPAGGSIDHVFNTDGLRTQFSLRDVLEPVYVTDHWEGQASYRRAMQLTAYFLAMIQHTIVPGSNVPNPSPAELAEQLRTAMQLAVNTIDFADYDGHLDDDDGDLNLGSLGDFPDQVSTCLTLDGPLGPITVCGVEKQPYITEVYVKRIKKGETRNTNPEWFEEDNGSPPQTYSIYAVELFNPYDTTLDLDGLVLRAGTSASPVEIDLALVGVIPKQSYVVVANRKDDLSTNPVKDPFITGATFGGDLFTDDALRIDNTTPIRLVRKNTANPLKDRLAELTPTGLVFPPAAEVEIDRVDQSDPGSIIGDPARWAIDAAELAAIVLEPSPPPENGKWLVRDSSLQRHKDPAYGHFTLSRQVLFPLPWYEHPDYPDPAAPVPILPSVIVAGDPRPDQHNLLNTGTTFAPDGLTNAQIVAREFAGIPFAYNSTVTPSPAIPDFPIVFGANDPIAGFPVLAADHDVHPNTGGTMAFPTTGTLLLVTRYAHSVDYPVAGQQLPVTVAATRQLLGITHAGFGEQNRGQMCQLDNGHLPVFDAGDPADPTDGQKCLDGNNSRFHGLPWGQLVFEYFTALPMEELARDLDPLILAGVQRLMDSTDYLNDYGAVGGASNWGDWTKSRFLNYPVMMPVSQASSPLGPRVQGRIGISNAPWWVLDGLPVLPDAMPGTVNAIPSGTYSTSALAGLPVPEIEARRLDPAGTAWNSMAGAWFVHGLIDEKYLNLNNAPLPYYDPVVPSRRSLPEIPPAGMPSISPLLAKYMVSYREQRKLENDTIDGRYADRIGFATAGEICNVLAKVQLDGLHHPTTNALINESHPLHEWRLWADSNNVRPFSYLGYLQLVTPIVRMQDWMTVKNHVFTIYATIQSSGQPPVTVRTQVTVDRTRCLYNPNDLPERITETPPISYYNAVDD